jgi:hypothetical protein
MLLDDDGRDRSQIRPGHRLQRGTDRTDFVVTSRDNPQPW